MFIRQYTCIENGKRQAYWALVESYRTARGPRQRVVAWLGKLDEAGRLGMRQAAETASKESPPRTGSELQRTLFEEESSEPELQQYRSLRAMRRRLRFCSSSAIASPER